jgi:glycerophosphoryl diester phosphodiesterase
VTSILSTRLVQIETYAPLFDQPPPWIIGHRGAAAEALENTLESFELAIAQGSDMVELDVQLTGDGRLAVFHDATLERLAQAPEVVEESALDRLRERFPPLSSLPEVLAALPADVPLNVEVKCHAASFDALIERLETDLGSRSGVLVSSKQWKLLEHARRAFPDLPLAPVGKLSAPELLDAAERIDAWSVHCHRRLAGEITASDSASDRPILAYTVNDAGEARRLFDLGVAGLFTDAPGRLKKELDR